jgi:N-acetylmuramate 1-kinase
MTPLENRSAQLCAFVSQHSAQYGLLADSLCAASADASFRQYFRIQSLRGDVHSSFIVMDAPPQHENCQPFIHVAQLLGNAGLNVPSVLEHDLNHGFLLLKDLGNTTYLAALQSGADHRNLYAEAITALVQLQAGTQANTLPAYDEDKLKTEMDLFETWFLTQHHGIMLNDRERALLQVALMLINKACARQAPVWVHRDYHCRNLMLTPTHNPGVLDFQDAVMGPYTYDLVSLLRDAYIDWPEEAQIELALDYWKKAQAAGSARRFWPGVARL